MEISKFSLYFTKTSLMQYNRCQQKYKRIYLDRIPNAESHVMFKGNFFHDELAKLYVRLNEFNLTDDFNDNYEYIRSLLPDEDDLIWDNLAYTEAERACRTDFTLFKPLVTEGKYKTIFCSPEFFSDYEDKKVSEISNLLDPHHLAELENDYGISPVLTVNGKVDYLFLEEDNTFRVHEFKSGNFNTGSQTKIRKELLLYKYLVEPHLCSPINHISYHFAYENTCVVEKIKKRSVTALKNLIYSLIKSTIDNDFENSYYFKACDNKCQFWNDCRLLHIRRH